MLTGWVERLTKTGVGVTVSDGVSVGRGVVVCVGVGEGGNGDGVNVLVTVGVGVIEGTNPWISVGNGDGANGLSEVAGSLMISTVIPNRPIEANKNRTVIRSKNGPKVRLIERFGAVFGGVGCVIMPS